MPAETLELPIRIRKPSVTQADVDVVCARLRGRGWTHADELCREIQFHGRPLTDRRLRKIAEFSDGRILSAPGSNGYRLHDSTASKEEVIRTADQHIAQGNRHFSRAKAILRRLHSHARE